MNEQQKRIGIYVLVIYGYARLIGDIGFMAGYIAGFAMQVMGMT